MNRWIEWFARNGVAANLLMLVVVVGGLTTLPRIREEIFPELESEAIGVTVEYPGAAPEEVEEGICMRIEEAVQGLADVKRVRSKAAEGLGTVIVEVTETADRRKLLDEVKARVDTIDTFPEDAEKPQVQELVIRRQVVDVAVSGDMDEHGLRLTAERVRDDISQLPGISLVDIGNAPPYEIAIEVSEESLRRFQLSFDQVAEAVRRASIDIPGGKIETRAGEILLRTEGQAYRGRDFEAIPVLTGPDGSRVELRDVARVVDGFADTDQFTRFDGKPALLVRVFRVGEQGAIDVADQVHAYIESSAGRFPEGVVLTTWRDDSKVLESRLDLMIRNGYAGLILVFVSLALFLRLDLAVWVTVGIPVSFLGAIWLLPALGVSINMISLFAFIVVLGIVVDDAIVVSESVYTRVQRGETGIEAAVRGTQEVGVPVVFAVLTTIAAFLPLLFVPGRYGEIMRVVPLIVIPTLVFSLLESLFVLPRHLSHSKAEPGRSVGGLILRAFGPVQRFFVDHLDKLASRIYLPLLRSTLKARYVAVALFFGGLALTVAFVASGRVGFTFFPKVDADNVAVFLTMPQGTPVERTEDAVRTFENAAATLREELIEETGADLFRHVVTTIGSHPFREAQNQNQGQSISFSGAHLAEMNLELVPSEERGMSSEEIKRRWERLAGQITGAESVQFSSSIFASGSEISVQLSSENLSALEAAAEFVKEELAAVQGTRDIADSFLTGKEEIELRPRLETEHFGVDLATVGRQVRQAFYGEEVQRIQRGRDDVKVMVRYPEQETRSLAAVDELRIRTAGGIEVPLAIVAHAELGRGYSAIDRAERRRVIDVSAGVDTDVGNETEIDRLLRNDILPRMAAAHPEVRASFEGDKRDRQRAITGLAGGLIVSLFLIYALLAIPFRSYLQPLIVMSAIPFGIAGAVWGHAIFGIDLTFMSFFGIVALTGVLVNDSLVLVDFVNRRVAAGAEIHAAVTESGVARFRAIFLTSLTTFASLTPLLLEQSLQAKFLVPMAVALGFGILFATVVTLFIVPVGYFVLEDIKKILGRVFGPAPRVTGGSTPGAETEV
jgi:multidrug efflux pump subunit AcrB